MAALLLALIVLVVLVWLLARWLSGRNRAGAGSSTWSLIERFEAVGKQAGAARRPEQGLVDYGQRLSHPEDHRPRDAGTSLSDLLYDPAAGDDRAAEGLLVDMERRPPPTVDAEPTTRWKRIRKRGGSR